MGMKRRREAEEEEEYNTVFVDTSLDTHLAVLVSCSDTVSDFKKKMVLEHVQCFPEIGEIGINSLKVKRRGLFYHLPDNVLLWSALQGVKGNWFLSADVSGALACCVDKKGSEPGGNDGVDMDVGKVVDENCRRLLASEVNGLPTFEVSLPVDVAERHGMSEMSAEFMVEESTKKTSRQTNYLGNCVENGVYAKKRKMKHNGDLCSNPHVEDNSTKFHESPKDFLQSEVVGCEISGVDALKEAPQAILAVEQQGKPTTCDAVADVPGVRNDQPDMGSRVAFEGTCLPSATEKNNFGCIVNSPRLLSSEERQDKTLTISAVSDKCQTEVENNIQTGNMENATVRDLNISDGSISGASKSKKRVKKTTPKNQDTPHAEQHEIGKGGRTEEKVTHADAGNLVTTFNSQGLVADDKQEDEAMLESTTMEDFMAGKSDDLFSLKIPTGHSEDVIMGEPNDSAGLMDTNDTAECTKSKSRKKKKRKAKKTATEIENASHLENENREGETIEGTSELGSLENSNSGRTSNSQIFLSSDERKEYTKDSTAQKSQNGFKENTPTGNLEGAVTFKEPNLPSRVTVSSGTEADAKSDSSKKKRKGKKTVAKVKDCSDMEHQSQNGESFQLSVAPAMSEKTNVENITSYRMKEDNLLGPVAPDNVTASKSENGLGHDVHSKGVSIEESNKDTNVTLADSESNITNKKRKRSMKLATLLQDPADRVHEIGKQESIEHQPENSKLENDEEIMLSLSQDQDMMLPSHGKVSDCFDRNLVMKEGTLSSKFSDADVTDTERKSMRQSRKKKRGKKFADADQDMPGMEQIDNGVNGHIQPETYSGDSVLQHKEKDVQLKSSDISNSNAVEKVQEASGIGEVSVLTQTKQNLEDVVTEKTKTKKKNQTSSASHVNIPVIEKESQVVESDQAEKRSENARKNDKRVKSKRKKREDTDSEVQENLPIKDQKICKPLTNADNGTSANSRQELPQVQLDKSKEKNELTLENAVSTNDLARPSESGDQGIDFKQYFVPGKLHDKVASGNKIKENKIKEATKANEGMQSGSKFKKPGSRSVSTSSEIRNPTGNQESENGSCIKTNGAKRQGDLALDSESTSRSLAVPGNEVKDSNSKDILEATTVAKHKLSSCLKEQNNSLAKSKSKTSERSPEIVGNKNLAVRLKVTSKTGTESLEKKNLFMKSGTIFQDRSASSDSNEMVMKTPEKKKLLTKSIFQGSSSESSGYKNGAVDSDATTCRPSDSSSVSGAASDSDGDLSVDSSGNEPADANGTPTGGKSMSKLDLSASKEMTMDMILRSSKRFKKAKLIASQELQENETQDMEIVPESQLNS